jgi:hypothetical protein
VSRETRKQAKPLGGTATMARPRGQNWELVCLCSCCKFLTRRLLCSFFDHHPLPCPAWPFYSAPPPRLRIDNTGKVR